MSDRPSSIEPKTIFPSKNRKISGFKKAVLASALGVLSILSGDTIQSPELRLNSNILLLDFFTEENAQNNNLLATIPKTDEEVKRVMEEYYKQEFGGHGQAVFEVMASSSELLTGTKNTSNITKIPVNNAINFSSIERDENGNPTAWVTISSDEIEKQIRLSPQSVINISFELGKIPVTAKYYSKEMSNEDVEKFNSMGFQKITINGVSRYTTSDGKVYTEPEYNELVESFSNGEIIELPEGDRDINHKDGYIGDNTYGNLRELAMIASKYPEKVFIAACGNPDINTLEKPDIREAKKKLMEEGVWGNNLIMIGFIDKHPYSHQIEPMQLGCDYYIDLNSLGIENASSFATAYTSELVSYLIGEGKNTQDKVSLELDKLSIVKTVDTTDSLEEIVEYKLLTYGNK